MCLKQYIVGRVLYLHNTKGGDQTKNTQQQQLCTVVKCTLLVTTQDVTIGSPSQMASDISFLILC